MHGHNYKIEVEVSGEVEPVFEGNSDSGMIMDFSELDRRVNQFVIEKLDHQIINNVLPIYPTAENLAQWVFDAVPLLRSGHQMERVRVWETSDSWAEVKR